jgi:AcrR family transcriptional regulator
MQQRSEETRNHILEAAQRLFSLNGYDATGVAEICQDAPDVPHILLQMTEVLTVVSQAADGRLPMFLEYWLQASRDEAIWKATIAPYRHYQEFFTTLMQRGLDEGSIRTVDPRIAAQTIVALAMGLLLQGLFNPIGADWPQVTRQSLQLFLDSLTEKNKGMEAL